MRPNFLLLFVFFFYTSFSFSQLLKTENGVISFDGSKEAFEPIKATSNKSKSLINPKTGEIACVIGIKDFKFRLGLMEEHFNESYLESHKYPKSTFEGVIQSFDVSQLTEIEKEFKIKGKLTIKGVSKEIDQTFLMKKTSAGISLQGSFVVQLSDFNIKVPKVVFWKISQDVEIKIDYLYEKS